MKVWADVPFFLSTLFVLGGPWPDEERGHKVTWKDVILHGERMKTRMPPCLLSFFDVGIKHKPNQCIGSTLKLLLDKPTGSRSC